jgi:outer membrane protein OmpA-like peptidoglycan-associated protein
MTSISRISLLLAIALAPLAAHAQADDPVSVSLPLDRYRPTIDDKGLLTTEGGGIPSHMAFQTGLLLNYALNPLVLRDGNGTIVAPLVAHRLVGDAQFTIGLFDYFSVGVDLPVTLVQTGGDLGDFAGAVGLAEGLAGIGVGDLKLIPKIRLLREDQHVVSLAIIPTLTLPTAGGLRFGADGPSYAYGGDYLGEGPGAVAFIPEVAVSTNMAGFRPALNVAYRLRQSTRYLDAFQIHPEIVYRLGLGYDLNTILAGSNTMAFVELYGATADRNPFGLLSNENPGEVRLQNPLEGLLGARYKTPIDGVSVEGGVATGLRAGFGSPDLRLSLGVRYSVDDQDKDDDGIDDAKDGCKDDPEDKDGFDDGDGCPDPDNDQDGIPDLNDKCAADPEDKDGFDDTDGCADPDNDGDGTKDVHDACVDDKGPVENRGCPAKDSDHDGITDDKDACKDVPGIAAKNGCPNDDKDNDGVKDVDDACVDVVGTAAAKGCPDKDGDGVNDADDACVDVAGIAEFKGCKDSDSDGIVDSADKCPTEPEVINGVDDGDGCPDKGKVLVVVTKEKIQLNETVLFDPGKDTILAKSFPLLDQVALVMKAHPELKKIRIEGHTDSDGDDAKNLDLSKRRAASVVTALVQRGIDAGRLSSEGYGETVPIADNKTKDGKAKNRRVDLKILDQ